MNRGSEGGAPLPPPSPSHSSSSTPHHHSHHSSGSTSGHSSGFSSAASRLPGGSNHNSSGSSGGPSIPASISRMNSSFPRRPPPDADYSSGGGDSRHTRMPTPPSASTGLAGTPVVGGLNPPVAGGNKAIFKSRSTTKFATGGKPGEKGEGEEAEESKYISNGNSVYVSLSNKYPDSFHRRFSALNRPLV